MSKVRVAVLRGGLSDEYAVSMRTGLEVLKAINTEIFDPIDVVISKCGEWIIDGRVRLPEHIIHCVDVVFIALHGTYGEDGTLQRFLDRYGVSYTGSNAFASNIAMNKIIAKNMLKDCSFKVAPHFQVSNDASNEIPRIVSRITDLFGPQYIIKPVSSGSSVGTMMVRSPLQLEQALRDALSVHETVMVEAHIPGKEVTCGVVERFRNEPVYALPPVEIVKPDHADFFDSQVKYDGTTREYCPARFDFETKRAIESHAKEIHQKLGLSQYSRSDFIIGKDGVYFLEVNTLPGLTNESLFPKALEAIGSPYSDFITHLLTDALTRK